ncbi:MAG: flagellar biosynthesis protein FlhF [Steroidobacteraceae bacterium]
MKIKTYTARDMRSALRMVREEMGDDAVILSSKRLAHSVEVTVAMDPDAALLDAAAAPARPARPAATTDAAPVAVVAALAPPVLAPAVPAAPAEFAELLARAAAVVAPPAAADSRVGDELRSMRHLLESQLAQLAWNDLTRRAPGTAELLKELTAMGLSSQLAADLLGELPAGIDYADGQRRALAHLTRRIAVTGDVLLDQGGRIAFVGPTGVGKTTAIAKLAARWVMRHGARDIALVSMDDQRFGAHEQLGVLGRLLGVESYTLDDPLKLPQLLERLASRRFVLIDTGGISPRDPELEERAGVLTRIARSTDTQLWLTLSAGAQAAVLEEAVHRFRVFEPRAVMLTKLDEAASLGGTVSALALSGMPVGYVANGPRIPEDLAPARAHQLVARAVALAKTSDASASDELLARKFGGMAHAIR